MTLTGRLFEYEVLGEAADSVYATDIKYLPYRQAVNQVKQTQIKSWDPTDPPTRSSNDLHALVALKLGLSNWSELRMYSAVGQPLDVFHGVDTFFELNDEICTIDLTLKDKGGYKADIEITPGDLESQLAMTLVAAEIASCLKGGSYVDRV